MASPAKSTPRKRPHCLTCGEPMKGHKRGCQTSPQAAASQTKESPAGGSRRKSVTPLETKMKALEIASPSADKREKQQRRRSSAVPVPVQTPEMLESLASCDKLTLDNINGPGMLTEEMEEEEEKRAAERIDAWARNVVPPKTLRRPRDSRGSPDLKPAIDATQALQDAALTRNAVSTAGSTKGGLHRTYSSIEMDAFLTSLEEKSTQPKTQFYRIPVAEVEELKARATRCKLFVRGAIPDKGDGWVVVGADKRAVEELCNRVADDGAKHEGGGLVKGVLGPGFVGAAITWVALAYS